MELVLPERTAIEVDWRDGVKLWVKTLNVWERDEAAEAAEVWAAVQARNYRPGGDGFLLLKERFAAVSEEDQSFYLAESGLLDGTWEAEAANMFGGADTSGLMLREMRMRSRYDDALNVARSLTADQRTDLCIIEAIRRRERNLRGYRLVCETLWRAVRLGGDHARRCWPDVGTVMELSDQERDYFWKHYEGMQLPPEEVPTWAAVSPE